MQKQVILPTATTERTNIPLYSDHITTSNFMELGVAKIMEVVPNQRIDVKHQFFTRLDPVAVPTFGRASIRNRAFFVPFRTVFPAWNDFITDSLHAFEGGSYTIPQSVPLIGNDVFVSLLTTSECSTVIESSDTVIDFHQIKGDGTKIPRRFTPYGKWVYKIIRSLGYSPVMDERCTTRDSALPLLCLLRVYNDWFFPAHYFSTTLSSLIHNILVQNVLSTTVVTAVQLVEIFRGLSTIAYEPDYFTAAWDNPNAPNQGLQSPFVINSIDNGIGTNGSKRQVISGSQSAADGTDNGPLLVGGSNGSSSNLPSMSQYDLNALRSLTDYLQRHKISGGRALERYLSRFGIKLGAEKLNRSVWLDEWRDYIQFSDVTSLASTEGETLGGYAGRGLGSCKGSFSFDSDEYGMIIIVTTIVPETQYYQGINRHIKHITKLDFYTPEFDGLGSQAIYKSELLAPLDNDQDVDMNSYNEGVFGFTGMYGEYKIVYNQMTGDFIIPSRDVGLDSWSLMRDVSGIRLNDVVHNFNFVTAQDKEQYNRIFDVTTNTTDKMFCIHSFEIISSFPGRSLFDTYEFKDEDDANKVHLPVNGDTLT